MTANINYGKLQRSVENKEHNERHTMTVKINYGKIHRSVEDKEHTCTCIMVLLDEGRSRRYA